VGEGRGAAVLVKNNNDPNKTLKMAQKSAFIDAVLRASGLSDFFTQDLGPDDEGSSYNHLDKKPARTQNFAPNKTSTGEIKIKNPNEPASKAQINLILSMTKDKGRTLTADQKEKVKQFTKGKASEFIDKLLKAKPKAKSISSGNPTDLQKEAKKVFTQEPPTGTTNEEEPTDIEPAPEDMIEISGSEDIPF
jgi:hypothetical protein